MSRKRERERERESEREREREREKKEQIKKSIIIGLFNHEHQIPRTKNHTHRIVWPPVRRPRFAKTTSSRARAVYARFRIFPPSLLPSLWLAPTHLQRHTYTYNRTTSIHAFYLRSFLSRQLCPLPPDPPTDDSPTQCTHVHTHIHTYTHTRTRAHPRNGRGCVYTHGTKTDTTAPAPTNG